MQNLFFDIINHSEDSERNCHQIQIGDSNETLRINPEPGLVDFKSAENLINKLNNEFCKVRDIIADELYEFYRQQWANIIIKASREKFKTKLKLKTIIIHTTTELDLIFKDGGLFYNHDIVVRFSQEKGFHNVVLSG